jgi:hypothetical protein
MGPWGAAIGGAMKISQAAGLNSTATKGAGGLNDALNFAASMLPGSGLFAKKTENYKVSEDLANSSGFGGTLANNQKMAGNAGRKVLFGRSKLNSKIKDAQAKDIAVGNILTDNKELMASQGENAQDISTQDMFMKMGGFDQSAFLVKNGGSIRELARKAKLQRERQLEEVASMQKGGRIGSKSIIPGGALHARKH